MHYLREEPLLDDVISDPIIRSLMHRDRIGDEFLRQIIANARARLDHGARPSRFMDAMPTFVE
jgi:hypothetical protein